MKTSRFYTTVLAILSISISAFAQSVEKVQQVVDKVRTERVPDRRQSVFDVKAEKQGKGVVVTGKISDQENYDCLATELQALDDRVENKVTLLPQDQWALIKIPVACMRSKAGYSQELATQTLLGHPVRVFDDNNGWYRIQSPDGYLGWVWRSSLHRITPEELEQWKHSPRLVVTSHRELLAYDSPTTISPRNVVTELLPGVIVEGNLDVKTNGKIEIALPDGRKAWADASAFTLIEQWADQPFDEDVILDQAYAMMGAPYLWGGTTAKMTDCSGLVKVSYLANGRILRRDASQQILTGTRIAPEDIDSLECCDLIFFGEKPGGRATHVGIYDTDKYFVHCAGRVHRSRMVDDDPSFGGRIYLGGTRIKGNDGSEGIMKAIDHPWLF